MSATTASATDTPAQGALEPTRYFPECASGVPIAVFAFGFAVTMLGLANSHIIKEGASLFVPVAFGTGAVGMLVGGLWEFRNNNLFGGTFGVAYACFLFTTALILRFFGPSIIASKTGGAAAFGDAFGAYLIVWTIFTAFFAVGAYYINVPAFLAFTLLAIVYLLAAIVNISQPVGTTLLKIDGWVAIADGLCAFWLGMGVVLNPMGAKPFIPMLPHPYGNRPTR